MRRDAVDFFLVEDAHLAIHKRLENWAAWCRGGGGRGVHPMFRFYRPDNYERVEFVSSVDVLDAARVQKGVSALPEKHRHATQWQYVVPCNPRRAAQELAVSLRGLADLVRAGRVMLINRGV